MTPKARRCLQVSGAASNVLAATSSVPQSEQEAFGARPHHLVRYSSENSPVMEPSGVQQTPRLLQGQELALVLRRPEHLVHGMETADEHLLASDSEAKLCQLPEPGLSQDISRKPPGAAGIPPTLMPVLTALFTLHDPTSKTAQTPNRPWKLHLRCF